MTSSIPPYPLAWPSDLPRTTSKTESRFKATLAQAIKFVDDELRLFGKDTGKAISDVSITSNVAGLSGAAPSDTGVAVWFVWEGQQRCIAVDRYAKVQDNLQAVGHIISARRTEMRHGGLHIVRTTFKGFTALPAPGGKKPWTEVLKVSARASVEEIGRAYRDRAKESAGNETQLLLINLARDEALAERRS